MEQRMMVEGSAVHPQSFPQPLAQEFETALHLQLQGKPQRMANFFDIVADLSLTFACRFEDPYSRISVARMVNPVERLNIAPMQGTVCLVGNELSWMSRDLLQQLHRQVLRKSSLEYQLWSFLVWMRNSYFRSPSPPDATVTFTYLEL